MIFVPKKFSGPKNIFRKKKVCSEKKNLVQKKFWQQKNINGPKCFYALLLTNLGIERLLIQKVWSHVTSSRQL